MTTNQILFKLFNRFSSLKERIYDNYYKSLCTVGDESFFHEEASVVNMQGQDKIKIGNGTHIKAELCVMPYGDGLSIGNNSYVGGGLSDKGIQSYCYRK